MDFLHKSFENINLDSTLEKYRHMKDEILPFLFELLYKISLLEEEMSIWMNKLKAEKDALGIVGQTHVDEPKVWAEYERRMNELITPFCAESLLKTNTPRAIQGPPRYHYLRSGCEAVYFTMKSPKRAEVEVRWIRGMEYKEKFVLTKIDDSWKVKDVQTGYGWDDKFKSFRI